MPDNPLELVTTEDLLTELSKRHDTLIIIGKNSKTKFRDQLIFRTGGDWFTMSGLLHYAHRQVALAIDLNLEQTA